MRSIQFLPNHNFSLSYCFFLNALSNNIHSCFSIAVWAIDLAFHMLVFFVSCSPPPPAPAPSSKVLMGTLLQQGLGRKNNRLPSLLDPWEGSDIFPCMGVRVKVCPEVGPEGWLRCFSHLWSHVLCRGYVQCPCFCSGPSAFASGSSKKKKKKKWQLGFLVSVSFAQNLS